tara:strand:- start:662 stop:3289 length:2628 start_codon:yes stop_codon:yes gene_type:complete
MCGGKGGGGGRPQVAGTQVVEQRSEFPDEIKPFITDILEKSQARFNQQTDAGYPIFPGGVEGRLAPMSAEQTEALEGYRQAGRSGIAGTGMSSARPYYEAGLSALGSSMGAFGPQQAQQYMNPYQQAVVDVAKREAIRQAQPTFRNIGDRAESTGAFGGSRQAIAEAEANRNLQQQLGDIQTRGMQQAFEQGRAAFEQQKAREAAGAGRMFAQAPAAFRQGLAEMAALEGVGKTTRAEDQRKKNLLYEQFQEEQMYPTKSLAEYQSIVRGFPYQPSMYRTEQNLAPSPGLGQQLLGGLGTAASIYGGMGGFSKGGFGSFGQAGGQVGGLASLASGGQIQGGGFETHQNNTFSLEDIKAKIAAQRGGDRLEELTIMERTGTLQNPEDVAELEQLRRESVSNIDPGRVSGFSSVKDVVSPTGNILKGVEIAQAPKGISSLAKGEFDPSGQKSGQTAVKQAIDVESFGNISGGKGNTTLIGGQSTDEIESPLLSRKDTDPALKNLLKRIEGFSGTQQETEEVRKKLIALAGKQADTKKRQTEKLTGIDKAHSHLDKYFEKFGTDLTKFTNKQLADNNVFKSEREAAINKRASAKLAKLASMGKDAKKTGEENAMQNLFLNMLLPMSLQAGQDPRGFIAGALQGGQDNMKAFVDRYSSLKDKYATGKEKREREGMDIRDKQQADIFDMQDKFNTRRDQIESQRFKLQKENDKLIATSGKSKQTEINAVKESELAMEAEAINTALDAAKLRIEGIKTDQAISAAGINAISKLFDSLGIGSAATKASNKSPSEQEKIMVQHIKDRYGFMLGSDGKSLFINGEAINEDDQRFQDMLKDVKSATSKFYSILRATGNTSYPTQVDARLQVMGQTPNVGFRVTSQ